MFLVLRLRYVSRHLFRMFLKENTGKVFCQSLGRWMRGPRAAGRLRQSGAGGRDDGTRRGTPTRHGPRNAHGTRTTAITIRVKTRVVATRRPVAVRRAVAARRAVEVTRSLLRYICLNNIIVFLIYINYNSVSIALHSCWLNNYCNH